MGALAITLREGLEVALVLAIVTAYLSKMGRGALRRYVYQGAAAAAAFSLAAAMFVGLRGIQIENELFEGVLYSTAALLVGSMFVWMSRTSSQMAGEIHERLDELTREGRAGAPVALFSLSFFLVAREGVEIVLFLSALALAGAGGLATFVGALSGLAGAAVLGVLFVRGAVKVDLSRFFRYSSLVLLFLAATFGLKGLHELMEAGLIPEFGIAERYIELLTGTAATNISLALLVAAPLAVIAHGLFRGTRPGRRADGPAAKVNEGLRRPHTEVL